MNYTPLSQVTLGRGTTYHRPENTFVESITMDSPAIDAMTDLSRVAAVTIEPGQLIAAANDKMIANGVRLLLVTNERNDVLGIISASDILGEKPTQFMRKTGCARSEILVQDIMTPLAGMEVLHHVDVERSRVGNVVETLKRAGRQHLLVADVDAQDNTMRVRGIFSATQIGRQLGIKLEIPEIAHSFAEVEAALMR